MSDLPAEGSLTNPYRENPPTRFVEVHWVSGVIAWPTKPFSYLERTGTTPLGDSFIGTASFWFRVNGTLAGEDPGSPALGSTDGIPIVFVIGPRHLAEGVDAGFYIRVRGNADYFQVQVHVDRAIGSIRAVIQPVDTNFAAEHSLPGGLCDNKWAHFLTTWDFSTGAGSGTLSVNKLSRTIYPQSISYDFVAPVLDIRSPSTIPAAVPWGEPVRFFGAHTVLSETAPPELAAADPLAENHKISLAHVWINTQHKIVDTSKFVTADDRPAPLGAEGEITVIDEVTGKPVGVKPDYYFSGGPTAFVKNNGGAGTTSLVGSPPIAQSIAPRIGA